MLSVDPQRHCRLGDTLALAQDDLVPGHARDVDVLMIDDRLHRFPQPWSEELQRPLAARRVVTDVLLDLVSHGPQEHLGGQAATLRSRELEAFARTAVLQDARARDVAAAVAFRMVPRKPALATRLVREHVEVAFALVHRRLDQLAPGSVPHDVLEEASEA